MTLTRANRLQYFARWFFCTTLLCVIGVTASSIWPFAAFFMLFTGIAITCFVVSMAVYFIYSVFILPIQRLHDMNASGWWALLSFVPIINTIFAFVLLFKRGTRGRNRFGRRPCSSKLEKWMIPISIITWIILLIMQFGA